MNLLTEASKKLNFTKHNIIIGVASVVAVGLVSFLLYRRTNNFNKLVSVDVSPEVLYIEGEPDKRVVRLPDGGEVIRPGDIALKPGFGVGEGTFGFGRFGSSFMA